jgi:predicted nucleotidyltransferase component of viral defense system
MIPALEIKERAREFGVPTSTIERDYSQNWLLSVLRPINMALKGGTGIRKVFIDNYRFSDDLDFTLLEPVGADTLRAAIGNAIVRVRPKRGQYGRRRSRQADPVDIREVATPPANANGGSLSGG